MELIILESKVHTKLLLAKVELITPFLPANVFKRPKYGRIATKNIRKRQNNLKM